jgi:acetyl-CoA acetyltransferase
VSHLGRDVAIVGVGYSKLSRGDDPDSRVLTLDACRGALSDAGVEAREVDGMFQYTHGPESPRVEQVQRTLGIENLACYQDALRTGPSGLGPGMMAVMAVASGVCDMAMAYRTLPQKEGNNARVVEGPDEAAGTDQFTVVYGNGARILSQYALKKQRRLAEFGNGPEEYGLISLNGRKWSAMNERAVLREQLTMDDYLSSRVIVDPLLLLDCDYPINGSCAILVTTGERARDLAQLPVYVDSMAWATGAGSDFYFGDDYLYGGSFECTAHMWKRTSLRPEDIDLLALYDGFTHLPISWIEAFGLCGKGEFFDWADGGKTIGPGGAVPLNTSGGMLAEGRLQGLGHVTEAVLQLRGACGARQVPNARVAAIGGGGSTSCGTMLLRV